jgi:hypothetical protein
VIGGLLDGVAVQFSTPAKRAATIAGMTTAAVCARRRLPFLVAVALSLVVAEGVERAYGAAADIESIARSFDPAKQLVFHHRIDCPGHEPGTTSLVCDGAGAVHAG